MGPTFPYCTYVCRRRLLKANPDDYWNYLLDNQCCPRRLKLVNDRPSDEKAHCPQCKEKFSSLNCLQHHRRQCYGRTQCEKCDKYIVGKKNQPLELLKSKHKCYQLICKQCYCPLPPGERLHQHLCDNIDAKFQTYFAPLGSCAKSNNHI